MTIVADDGALSVGVGEGEGVGVDVGVPVAAGVGDGVSAKDGARMPDDAAAATMAVNTARRFRAPGDTPRSLTPTDAVRWRLEKSCRFYRGTKDETGQAGQNQRRLRHGGH